jgi:hypothetical protein
MENLQAFTSHKRDVHYQKLFCQPPFYEMGRKNMALALCASTIFFQKEKKGEERLDRG